MPFWTKKMILGVGALLLVVIVAGGVLYGLEPLANASTGSSPIIFEVKQGEGFRAIIGELQAAHLIRSSFATETIALLTGKALSLQPGSYRLSPQMSPVSILESISGGQGREVSVTIPEGSNIYQIDSILAKASVIGSGGLVNFRDGGNLEGKLFPDTYRFFTESDVKDVAQKFLDNFNAKAAPLLATDPQNATSDIIVASMVEKEVPDPTDQKIVAGILWKREKAGMPLDVDATVCYAMQLAAPTSTPDCSGGIDLKIDSAYNTYLNKGFPPFPIGNPGISAIQAAIHPTPSPYWFYLSDPKTGKTIFAKTLDEQHQNTVKYLVR